MNNYYKIGKAKFQTLKSVETIKYRKFGLIIGVPQFETESLGYEMYNI